MILDQIQSFIRRYVWLKPSQLCVVTLWVAHTHTIDFVDTTPYLAIVSAEKQSGKTRLLEVLEQIVAKPWLTGRVTPAVLARKVEAEGPTLLLDEFDTTFGTASDFAETLRNLLNTGYRRGGKVSCCVRYGDKICSQDFSTFCAKALAGIGRVPSTVADRSIPIRLKRAMKGGEEKGRFRQHKIAAEVKELRAELKNWCASIGPHLSPVAELTDITDRQQDCAEPLLSIAELAGGDWPTDARNALIDLWAEKDSESVGWQLLFDIRSIFDARQAGKTEWIRSVDLAAALAEIETSSWGDCLRGRPLSPNGLARLLEPFGIQPVGFRAGSQTPRGYHLDQFEDAFKRYLPSRTPANDPPSATVQQNESGDKEAGTAPAADSSEQCGSPQHDGVNPKTAASSGKNDE